MFLESRRSRSNKFGVGDGVGRGFRSTLKCENFNARGLTSTNDTFG